jgi:hypothetical protein
MDVNDRRNSTAKERLLRARLEDYPAGNLLAHALGSIRWQGNIRRSDEAHSVAEVRYQATSNPAAMVKV